MMTTLLNSGGVLCCNASAYEVIQHDVMIEYTTRVLIHTVVYSEQTVYGVHMIAIQ